MAIYVYMQNALEVERDCEPGERGLQGCQRAQEEVTEYARHGNSLLFSFLDRKRSGREKGRGARVSGMGQGSGVNKNHI